MTSIVIPWADNPKADTPRPPRLVLVYRIGFASTSSMSSSDTPCLKADGRQRSIRVVYKSKTLLQLTWVWAWWSARSLTGPRCRLTCRWRVSARVRSACSHAAEQGVRLAIETHTALPVPALAELIDRVDAPNLGVVLDTANVVRVGSDLIEATRLLAPLTDMVHVKDLDLSEAGSGNPGGWWPCTSLGQGDLDLEGVLAELRSVGFEGLVCVELATLPSGSQEDRMVKESITWLRESIGLTG